jgi:hypothetical protein
MMLALACTVARAADGKVLAKQVGREADGSITVRGYDHAARFTLTRSRAADLRTFARGLFRLARDPHAAVLRGDLRSHVKPGVAYLRRARAGDGTDSLVDSARAWIMVDFDDVSAPEGLDWLRDPAGTSAFLETLLPGELRGIDHVLHYSGRAGFSADHRLIRAHLWVALAVPISDDDLRRWAMAHNARVGSRLIDWSLFNPVQLHYTADPVLSAGIADPVLQRWHFIDGPLGDRAHITPPPAKELARLPSGGTLHPGGGVGAWLSRIGSVEWGFFEAIKGGLGAAARAGLSRDMAVAATRAAVLAADPGHRKAGVITHYADSRYLGTAYDQFVRRDAARRRAETGREFRPWPDQRAGALKAYIKMKQDIERRRMSTDA